MCMSLHTIKILKTFQPFCNSKLLSPQIITLSSQILARKMATAPSEQNNVNEKVKLMTRNLQVCRLYIKILRIFHLVW